MTPADQGVPAWFELSAMHFEVLLSALKTHDRQEYIRRSDPREHAELVDEIINDIGDALASKGFDAADRLTGRGRILEDLIDYLTPYHPDYRDDGG